MNGELLGHAGCKLRVSAVFVVGLLLGWLGGVYEARMHAGLLPSFGRQERKKGGSSVVTEGKGVMELMDFGASLVVCGFAGDFPLGNGLRLLKRLKGTFANLIASK